MIFVTHIHRYTVQKKKIETREVHVEADCLESWYRKTVTQCGYMLHDLHFHYHPEVENNLFRFKIVNRYKQENSISGRRD